MAPKEGGGGCDEEWEGLAAGRRCGTGGRFEGMGEVTRRCD